MRLLPLRLLGRLKPEREHMEAQVKTSAPLFSSVGDGKRTSPSSKAIDLFSALLSTTISKAPAVASWAGERGRAGSTGVGGTTSIATRYSGAGDDGLSAGSVEARDS